MFKFKSLTEDYFPLLFKWLQQTHVKAWWDSETEWSAFIARFETKINNPLVHPFIVFSESEPIAYIQYWFVEEDSDFKSIYPPTTVGTDQFIGESDLIGKGIGPKFIKRFTDDLLLKPEIELVITDPDARNAAAIRAYEKAGFQKARIMNSRGSTIQLLEKHPQRSASPATE